MLTSEQLQLLLGIGIGIFIGCLLMRMYLANIIREERKDATKKSRNVILGEVNEKIAPLLPGFPYDVKDLVFIGKGIDYLVFDGLSEGNLQKIVFLELKSGGSHLNLNEKQIKNCISRNRISYELLRISI